MIEMKKNIIVTGGSGEIGKQISLDLVNNGYTVIFTYCENQLKADDLLNQLNETNKECTSFKLDVSDVENVQSFAQMIEQRFGQVYGLVNCAGISPSSDMLGKSNQKEDAMSKLSETSSKPRLDVFNAWLVDGAKFVGRYEFPQLAPCYLTPKDAIPFSEVNDSTDREQWIHFYSHDYQFESLWRSPKDYLVTLQSFQGVIAPDFSIYREMPLAMQIWNTYRNRALSYWLQQNGVNVIPNVRWGAERTWPFCFDGIPKNSPVAISTNGCIQDKVDRQYFKLGLRKMVEVLRPSVIINYSYMPDDIFEPYKQAGLAFIHLPNRHDVVRGRVDT